MNDFAISRKIDPNYQNGVCLRFCGKPGIKLHISDTTFIYADTGSGDEYKNVLATITLGDAESIRHFDFPRKGAKYKALKFYVQQQSVARWLVRLDLETGDFEYKKVIYVGE